MGLIDPYYVVFLRYKVFAVLPQVWRIVTPFILTGPKLGLLMDPYFLYTYGSQLETGAARFTQPGDFFVYLVFVCTIILVSLAYHPLFLYLPRPRFITPAHITNTSSSARTASQKVAATIPEYEGENLCTVRRSIIRKITSSVRGVWNMVGFRIEITIHFQLCGAMVVIGPYIPRHFQHHICHTT